MIKLPALPALKDYLNSYEGTPVALTPRELELIDGMIEVQLHHAAQCDGIANRTMADKQRGWDMERVELLRKLRGIKPVALTPLHPCGYEYVTVRVCDKCGQLHDKPIFGDQQAHGIGDKT